MAFGHSFTPSVRLVDAGIRLRLAATVADQRLGSTLDARPGRGLDPPLRPVDHPAVEFAGEIMTKARRLRMIFQPFVASIAPAQIVAGGEGVRVVGLKTSSVSARVCWYSGWHDHLRHSRLGKGRGPVGRPGWLGQHLGLSRPLRSECPRTIVPKKGHGHESTTKRHHHVSVLRYRGVDSPSRRTW